MSSDMTADWESLHAVLTAASCVYTITLLSDQSHAETTYQDHNTGSSGIIQSFSFSFSFALKGLLQPIICHSNLGLSYHETMLFASLRKLRQHLCCYVSHLKAFCSYRHLAS